MELNISTGLWQFDSFPERFVPEGYQPDVEWKRQLEIFSGIEGLNGFAPCVSHGPPSGGSS